MEQNRKNLSISTLPLMLMSNLVFTAASLVFTFVLDMSEPVPVFIFFAMVQMIGMLLFVILPEKRKHIGRKVSMIITGSTILFLAGILARQNFQVEGLVFMLLAGVFGGPVIHFIMKITGTLFTGRSWCSWGCWTAAVLDFLPYKTGTSWKDTRLPKTRYIHLAMSTAAVIILYSVFGYTITATEADAAGNGTGSIAIVYWFITGNLLYYAAGIALAVRMKDNRAFCKYLCPVAVPLKAAGIFSLLRIKGRDSSCAGCRKCEENCPASIKIHSYVQSGERVASTECIMCLNCAAVCPRGNLKASLALDLAKSEKLNTCGSR